MSKGSRDKGIAQAGFLVAENQEDAVINNVFSPLAYENSGLKKQEDSDDGLVQYMLTGKHKIKY